jgi:hypothetical protein
MTRTEYWYEANIFSFEKLTYLECKREYASLYETEWSNESYKNKTYNKQWSQTQIEGKLPLIGLVLKPFKLPKARLSFVLS